ncbi:MAG: DNA polymerase III subunit delta [Bacteroidales bacterium]|nr:DNA polymerase III subunit delta [Bacteroidales bacterium]
MQFKEIAGHKSIKEKLIQTVNEGRIPHAQLFYGQAGSGSFGMALAYATFISCQQRLNDDSCGTCPSCLKYNKLIHPDLHFVFPVNTGKLVSKDPLSDDYLSHWREFVLKNHYFHESQWYEHIGIENKQGFIGAEESQQIIKKLNFKPYESEYKIMIIWLPEKMNAASANKLLKVLEEPSENTIFLLVSESVDLLLPTILSRVQMVKFGLIEDEDMRLALQSKHGLNDIENIVHLANGNYLRAIDSIEANEENTVHLEKFSEFMRLAYKCDIQKILDFSEDISSIGREKQKRFLLYSIRMIRENLMLNFGQEKIVYLENDERKFSDKFFPFVNQRNTGNIYNQFNKTLRDVESNANVKILFVDLGLKLHELLRM